MNQPLIKRTAFVTLAMLGATALWVGALSAVAVRVADRLAGGAESATPSWTTTPADAPRAKVASASKPNG